jgi:hypothetical protein
VPRRHPLLRAVVMLVPLVGSTARLHAHSADTPIAVTQELNRCLTMVRIAATRRTASQGAESISARTTSTGQRTAIRGKYDDYKVPAGTPLQIRLRSNVDSASARVDDPIRATLTQPITQEGFELVPVGSLLHGKLTQVTAAARNSPLGRIVLEFHVVEHAETHSLAMITTRPVTYEAMPQKDVKLRDVQIAAGETVTVTLARPLIVHLPRRK